MDRSSSLRRAWIAPLIALLFTVALCWAMRNASHGVLVPAVAPPPASNRIASTDLENESQIPAEASVSSDEHSRWLPPLASQPRAILTSYTLDRQESKPAEADGEGPLLVPPLLAQAPSSPTPSTDTPSKPKPTQSPVFVPEPDLLPDGVAETGEPIPPRLPQRPGQPVPAPESARLAKPIQPPASEPWQPTQAAAPAGQRSVTDVAPAGQAPSLLIPATTTSQRSNSLELIAREADVHTRRGFELAGRGAYLAARAEFVAALRVLAQGLDTETQRRVHSQALATGLTAMKEAEDFLPDSSRLEADLDLAGLISRHRTPALRGTDTSTLTSMTALQCYLTFAQEQLGTAVGREVAGSMALRGLGKLYEGMAEKKFQNVQVARPKAMAFYQAALLSCPQNYLASNDLGVLLARNGRFDDARLALEHSLSITQQATAWRNLAIVYQQLGHADWAQQAQQRFEVLQRTNSAQPGGRSPSNELVQWIDPQTFAQTTSEQPNAPVPSIPAQQATGPKVSPPEGEGQHVAKSPLQNRPDRRK
jgi:tetratricopeptide (TPR) repeat protein